MATPKTAKDYEELVAAIKWANDWVKAGEGVSILYYLPKLGDEDPSSLDHVKLLSALLKQAYTKEV
jgi:hypothetical protein